MRFMVPAGRLPARSARKYLSMVISCDTLATQSLGSPVIFFESLTLPGGVCQSYSYTLVNSKLSCRRDMGQDDLRWTNIESSALVLTCYEQ
jgi:hypothetical protein